MGKKSVLDKIIKNVDKSLNENFENYKDIKKKVKETFSEEKENNKEENKEVLFCTKCGAKMDYDDLFCESCGAKSKKVEKDSGNKKEKPEENEEDLKQDNKREKITAYSCPNCGASLESYTSNCPYCHTEIRNISSSKSLENFSKGLEKIKSKEMPKFDGKESLLKKTIGIDLSKDVEAREEFEMNFINKIDEEVATYINNYPVPNSKEDLIEFMILVTSNISSKDDDPDVIKEAWISKMNQIYEKSKLTLKNKSDMKIIEDLYTSKKQELKGGKVDNAFAISFGICLYIALMITIGNWMFGLSFLFFSLGIMTFLYYLIKGEGAKIFKTSINITKRLVKVLMIIFFVMTLIFLVAGIIKLNTHSKEYNDYYDETVLKNDVTIEIDFEKNLIFNKYDVKLSVYDQEINLPHGKNKTINLELPNGKHQLKFSGDGMAEYVDLKVKGDTVVKYKISCHTNEIKVSELEIEYIDDSYEVDSNNDEFDDVNDEVNEEKEQEQKENTKIIVSKNSSDFKDENYKDTESYFKSIGFKNIKTTKKDTTDSNNTNENVVEVTIDGKEFDADSEFDLNSEVSIVYWNLKEEPKEESVYYSTNDKASVKDGDKGVYAYKNRGGAYDIYWIIDFDAGYVYNYFDGNGDESCDRLKIDYGNLNDYVKITWHDGSDEWSYGLHFKYKSQPDHLIVQDNDGFEYDFYSTRLDDALKIRDKKSINDY